MKATAPLLLLCACALPFAGAMAPMGAAGAATPAASGDIAAQQHEAFARSSGYPTKKTRAELDAQASHLLAKYQLAKTTRGQLDAVEPIAIDGVRGTCYAVVLRLINGASWDRGADAGMIFDVKTPTGPAMSGPGLIGPGAIGMTPCADATGPIAMQLAAIDHNPANAPIGHGEYTIELWTHKQTAAEARAFAADQQRQEDEAKQFEAKQAADHASKMNATCSKCSARYEGCIGAGRPQSSCGDDYRSCTFEGGDTRGECQR